MSDVSDYDRETMQRINRANSAAGGIAMMPEEWAATVRAGNRLNRGIFTDLPYDDDPVAQRIAGRMVNEFIKVWDLLGRRTVWRQWCPEHDDARPETMANLYVLTLDGVAIMVAIQNIAQLPEVAEEALGTVSLCQAQVTRLCAEDCATETLPVKRGEYICLFKACLPCLEHIETGAQFNENYIGPEAEWFDNRSASPDQP